MPNAGTAEPTKLSKTELLERVAQITWCHPIDFGDGIVTRPEWHVRQRFARRLKFLALPEDLTGKTVLDIGAWDGFFSFECERRGAARVLAIDTYAWDVHGKQGFLLAHSVLNSKVESLRLAAEDLDSKTIGRFDLVLFLGVLYHLRSPITVLDRLRDVTAGTLVCETHGLVPALHARYPLISFFPGDGHERGTAYEFTAYAGMPAADDGVGGFRAGGREMPAVAAAVEETEGAGHQPPAVGAAHRARPVDGRR
jgi:tRNA (mo5U34)-methyltransferase